MFKPNNLSVRASLIQVAVWAVVGNLLILLAYVLAGQVEQAALERSARATTIRQQADEVFASVYRLSALEQQLLRTRDLTLRESHQSVFAHAQEQLSVVERMAAADTELRDVAVEIKDALNRYDAIFTRALAKQEVVGVSQDTGLTGELGAVSDAVEYRVTSAADSRLALVHRRVKGAERSYQQTKNPQFLEAFESAHGRLLQFMARLDMPEQDRAAFAEELNRYLSVMQTLVREQTILSDEFASLQAIVGTIPPLVDQIRSLTAIRADTAAETVANTRFWANIILIGIVVLVGGFLVVMALWLLRRISGPLQEAVAVCQRVAEGQINFSVPVGRSDEIGELMSTLAQMSDRLRLVVGDVRDASQVILSGASEISAANDHLSNRTEQSAANLEQTAASMDQMTATVQHNSANATQAAELAERARSRAQEGGTVVHRAMDAMNDINESSKRVESVIRVVDEIAFQTNLLALNAAVEAARAGEAGRGFAVVASEVRHLAQRSAAAAAEVKKLIGESTEKVVSGQKLVNESGSLLEQILEEVERVATTVRQIDVATREQSEGIQQVNQAVLELDKVTQQNAAMVEEAAAASRAVEERARDLASKVDYFQIDGHDESPALPKPAPTARIAASPASASTARTPAANAAASRTSNRPPSTATTSRASTRPASISSRSRPAAPARTTPAPAAPRAETGDGEWEEF